MSESARRLRKAPNRATSRFGSGKCPVNGKVRYRDHEQAVRALHSTMRARRNAQDLGQVSPRQEKRIYACHACAGFHLTSEPMRAERDVA